MCRAFKCNFEESKSVGIANVVDSNTDFLMCRAYTFRCTQCGRVVMVSRFEEKEGTLGGHCPECDRMTRFVDVADGVVERNVFVFSGLSSLQFFTLTCFCRCYKVPYMMLPNNEIVVDASVVGYLSELSKDYSDLFDGLEVKTTNAYLLPDENEGKGHTMICDEFVDTYIREQEFAYRQYAGHQK